jgi:hypothetical protein
MQWVVKVVLAVEVMEVQVQADLELLLVELLTQAVVVVALTHQVQTLLAADQVLLSYVGLQHNNEF